MSASPAPAVEPSIAITLVCWHCGRQQRALVSSPPQFAFEVVAAANAVGMLGVFDMHYHRALVFCDGSHADAEKTRSGIFRKYPKGVTASAPAETSAA